MHGDNMKGLDLCLFNVNSTIYSSNICSGRFPTTDLLHLTLPFQTDAENNITCYRFRSCTHGCMVLQHTVSLGMK